MKSLGPRPLAYPAPVWCIGSYDKNGVPNVMTASWGGICCSNPASLTVSLRKATYTYGNLMDRMAYTISVPSEKYVAEADYFGLATGRRVNKFEASGLTPVRAEFVDAPYVAEFPMVIECRVAHTFKIGLHTQFVGEIVDVKVDDKLLNATGLPDLQKVAPFVYAPEDRKYYAIGSKIGDGFELGKPLARKR